MKSLRLLGRTALLSLVATAFVGLTEMYGNSTPPSRPSAAWQTERSHRPHAPHVRKFPEFAGEGMLVALYAVVGRLGLRLRLSPAPRIKEYPTTLNL